MPEHPFIDYGAPFTANIQPIDTVATESVVPSFLTQGFGHAVTPLPRVTYDILQSWDLVLIAVVLLLIVLNKQLYPRQFRQVLSVPGGVAHTNQLLREWNPVGSFLGTSCLLSYIIIISLFVQKSCVILSRDVMQYNSLNVLCMVAACVLGWLLLRFAVFYIMNWLFGTKDTVDRQMTVQLSVSTYSLFVMLLLVVLLLYNPISLFVWIGFGIISFAAAMRLAFGIIETRISTKISWFYIFSYLCALEIAPVATLLTAGLRYFSHGTVF
jgi:hypothetical protein